MNYLLSFYDADGNEIAKRAKEYDLKEAADLAYDTAVSEIDQGTAGNACKVTYNDGGRVTKQHGRPSSKGTVERVEAEHLEREGDSKQSEDEKRAEADKEDREDFKEKIVVPEEVRNPDAGTLPPHDPNPPKVEFRRAPKRSDTPLQKLIATKESTKSSTKKTDPDPFNKTIGVGRVSTTDGPKVVTVKTETKKP